MKLGSYSKKALLVLLSAAAVGGGTVSAAAMQTAEVFAAQPGETGTTPVYMELNSSKVCKGDAKEYFYYFKTNDDLDTKYTITALNNNNNILSIPTLSIYERYGNNTGIPDIIFPGFGVPKSKTFTLKRNTQYLIKISDPTGINAKITVAHTVTGFTGLKYYEGTWTNFKNGSPDYNYTGLSKAASGKWYYVKKGVYDTSFTGLCRAPSGNWYHVTRGKLDLSYTGLSRAASGKWYYVWHGIYNKYYTGIAPGPSGKLYYLKNGKYDTSFSGRVLYKLKLLTVKNGRVV